MSEYFYLSNPDLREYYLSLPQEVRELLLETGAEVATLGELQLVVDPFMPMPPII